MDFNLDYRGKTIPVSDVKTCVTSRQRAWGLIFRSKDTNALVFPFKNPTNMAIHSLFVFFPFLAVWTTHSGEIIEKQIVKPFTFHIVPKKPFCNLIEIPLNKKYSPILKILDDSKV